MLHMAHGKANALDIESPLGSLLPLCRRMSAVLRDGLFPTRGVAGDPEAVVPRLAPRAVSGLSMCLQTDAGRWSHLPGTARAGSRPGDMSRGTQVTRRKTCAVPIRFPSVIRPSQSPSPEEPTMTALTEFVELDRRGRVAVITINNPPNNVLSHGVRKGLKDGIVAASRDAAISAMLITCAGRTFIAGGDTTEFVRPPQGPGLHEVLDLIEGATKPVVAAIHGTALLGGLEVILACHYRVGVPAARFGLPGVTMGLLPGAGGTQRLPRVV